MSGRIDIADLLPRPLHSRPAVRASAPCPRCGCGFVVDRVTDGGPTSACAYCGRTRELPA